MLGLWGGHWLVWATVGVVYLNSNEVRTCGCEFGAAGLESLCNVQAAAVPSCYRFQLCDTQWVGSGGRLWGPVKAERLSHLYV
jgi:hypothetical protein